METGNRFKSSDSRGRIRALKSAILLYGEPTKGTSNGSLPFDPFFDASPVVSNPTITLVENALSRSPTWFRILFGLTWHFKFLSRRYSFYQPRNRSLPQRRIQMPLVQKLRLYGYQGLSPEARLIFYGPVSSPCRPASIRQFT